MTPKEKAEALVNSYRMILMNEDTECGNEILCTSIAKKCALIAVDEILNAITFNMYDEEEYNKVNDFWEEVKKEILNL
jgi:hypothetical protein